MNGAALFQLLHKRIPCFPGCADYPIEASWRRDKDLAIQENAIIQINRKDSVHTIVLDIDRQMSERDIAKLPGNLVAINPRNGHLHLFIILENWVKLDGAKPDKLLSIVKSGLTRKLQADAGYAGYLAKNPFHESWDVRVIRERLFSLSELRAMLPNGPARARRKGHGWIDPDEVERGMRHNTLFRMAQRYCLMAGRDPVAFSLDYNNRMPIPLPAKDAVRIAENAQAWCRKVGGGRSFSVLQKWRAHSRWDRSKTVLRDRWRTNLIANERPWRSMKISRTTWYRRRAVQRCSESSRVSLSSSLSSSGKSVVLPSYDSRLVLTQRDRLGSGGIEFMLIECQITRPLTT